MPRGNRTLHFWYSAKQKARLRQRRRLLHENLDARKKIAVIKGKEVEYTAAAGIPFTTVKDNDLKYLGKGKIKY